MKVMNKHSEKPPLPDARLPRRKRQRGEPLLKTPVTNGIGGIHALRGR